MENFLSKIKMGKENNFPRRRCPKRKSGLFVLLFATAFILVLVPGCSRKKYREAADKEVYDLLNTVGDADPLWQMSDFSLEQDGQSRYGNFYDQDKQPMPRDDATAHRLMASVDGKKGGKRWYKNGMTNTVENLNWAYSLPEPIDGKIIIDQQKAYDLALLHSPEYRNSFESVYLSALNVTAERFVFDVQFFGGESLFYNNKGGFKKDKSVSTLANDIGDSTAFMKRKFASGGELLAGLANSMTWTFGPDGNYQFTPITSLSYEFTQPFLRGAGRAIVLEDLTRAERQLLANVRQLAFYQQGFYVNVLTGSSPVTQPASGAYPGRGISTVRLSGGFYGLLSSQVLIRNQLSNVISYQDNLHRYEELFKAGRITDLSTVDRVRQSMLSSQSSLISQRNSYHDSVDSYLMQLGLPPDIDNIEVQDPLLDEFVLMPETLTALQEKITQFLAILRSEDKEIPENLAEIFQDIRATTEQGERETLADIGRVETEILPQRMAGYEILRKRLESQHPELDRSFCDQEELKKRIAAIRADFSRDYEEKDEFGTDKAMGITLTIDAIFRLWDLTILKYDRATLTRMLEETKENPGNSPFSKEVIDLVYQLKMESTLLDSAATGLDEALETSHFTATEDPGKDIKKELAKKFNDDIERETEQILTQDDSGKKVDPYRIWLRDCMSLFDDELMTMRLIQARARLECVNLSDISIESDDAIYVASQRRFDWMNARSYLVDEWRNIEIVADRLKGDLSVSVGGSIDTSGSSNPLKFQQENARFTTGVQFDAPLTRLLERNAYRQVLISYDRTRRDYYHYVDSVKQQLRSIIRSIQLSQMDFELKRVDVLTAVKRVHQAQLELTKPPVSGSSIGNIGSTAAQNLVDSLNDLLTAQNKLLTTWLEYQTSRMGLLLAMGVFELDETGRWIDPGDINTEFLQTLATEFDRSQDELAGLDRLPETEELTGGLTLEQVQARYGGQAEENSEHGTRDGTAVSSPIASPQEGTGSDITAVETTASGSISGLETPTDNASGVADATTSRSKQYGMTQPVQVSGAQNSSRLWETESVRWERSPERRERTETRPPRPEPAFDMSLSSLSR
ncbi:MAG: TolC family protein [Planctomycetia bacterium]|nr:TolC family protein [Planctomycetia bacterium]